IAYEVRTAPVPAVEPASRQKMDPSGRHTLPGIQGGRYSLLRSWFGHPSQAGIPLFLEASGMADDGRDIQAKRQGDLPLCLPFFQKHPPDGVMALCIHGGRTTRKFHMSVTIPYTELSCRIHAKKCGKPMLFTKALFHWNINESPTFVFHELCGKFFSDKIADFGEPSTRLFMWVHCHHGQPCLLLPYIEASNARTLINATAL
ncbi:MAG: hypothetical protein K2Q10_01150, partial [Rhodospirillales bacterium]|nr:hypothetical protein [Rhodospirillales bacterium]